MSEFERYVPADKKGNFKFQLSPGRFAIGLDGKDLALPLHELMAMAQRREFDQAMQAAGFVPSTPQTDTSAATDDGATKATEPEDKT